MRRALVLLLALLASGCQSLSLGGGIGPHANFGYEAKHEGRQKAQITVEADPRMQVAVQATVTTNDPPASVEQNTKADGWKPTTRTTPGQ